VRSRRAIFTFSTGVALAAVTTIVGLVATPFLLRWLGDERYGAYRALAEWAGYLTLLDLGLGGATLTVLAKALASGPAAIASAVRAAVRGFAIVAMLMLAGGLALAAAAPWLVPVSTELRGDVRFAAAILCAGTLLVIANPLRALIETAQRGYVINLLLLIQSLTLTILALVFARAGGGVKGQALATVIAGGTFVFAVVIYVWRARLARAKPHLRQAQGEQAESASDGWSKELWNTNWHTMALDLSGRASTMSDSIVIALFINPVAVTPFVLTLRLMQVATAQILGIGSATWAALASLHHAGEGELLQKRLIELSRIVVLLGGATLVPIAAYNRAFVRLWVGEQFYGGDRLTIAAACAGILGGLLALWGWVFRGAGVIRPVVPVSVSSAVVNVAVSVGLTAWLGWLEGPVIGTVVSFVAIPLWCYPLMLRRHFGLPVRRFVGALSPVMAATAAYGAAAWWAARQWPPGGWIELALMMMAAAAVFVVIGWFGLLSRDERGLWVHRLRLLSGGLW
jgi:O-antigen/teichoic acid export membrane protein